MIPPLALVIRTQDHASCITETLRRLHEQVDFAQLVSEIVHIDMGSQDGTVGMLRQYEADKLIQLEPAHFQPGAALNMGMRQTSAPWVVFLSGDALPETDSWLKNLATALHLERGLGALVSRQKAPPGTPDVFARLQKVRFGDGARAEGISGRYYSAAATAISREAWLSQHFREDLPACIMEEWAGRVEPLGWRVNLTTRAAVLVTLRPTLGQTYRQSFLEAIAWARAESDSQRRLQAGQWRGSSLRTVAHACFHDLKYSFEEGNVLQWPYSVAVQVARYLGQHRGYAKARAGDASAGDVAKGHCAI